MRIPHCSGRVVATGTPSEATLRAATGRARPIGADGNRREFVGRRIALPSAGKGYATI